MNICYNVSANTKGNPSEYEEKRRVVLQASITEDMIVSKKTASVWSMKKDDLCRISVIEGSQVGDINMWNLQNKKEHFYSGKTRQIHGSHLSLYDRLWSNLPYLRPMATVVGDSINYGVDEDGAGVHDVIVPEYGLTAEKLRAFVQKPSLIAIT